MKSKFIYFFLICTCLFCCNKKNSNTFILDGEINGLRDSSMILLSYLLLINDKYTEVNDTAYIKDSRFIFKNNIDDLIAAFLSFENTSIRLYLEPVTMHLKINKERPWEYKLSSTQIEPENQVLRGKLKIKEEELHKEINIAYDIIEKLNLSVKSRDSLLDLLEKNRSHRDSIIKQMDVIKLNYISENKNSKIAPDLIFLMSKNELNDIDTLKKYYDNLSKDIKKTSLGKLANKQIEKIKLILEGRNITVGSAAPDFSRLDFSGKEIQLSKFYSQNYVLLDFWASWCKPCLVQIPQMKELYKISTNNQLKIIGISLDEDRQQWLDTIEKCELDEWTQILSQSDFDIDYFASNIADLYGIETIPQYLLIDKQGQLIIRWQHLGRDEIQYIKNLISNTLPQNKVIYPNECQ